MFARILMILVVGMLSSCISGRPHNETYTDRAGKTTLIESDRESCTSSCDTEYSRCMETNPAQNNEGVHGPTGMFGASADCHNSLKSCLQSCKSR